MPPQGWRLDAVEEVRRARGRAVEDVLHLLARALLRALRVRNDAPHDVPDRLVVAVGNHL